jgi:DNA (cytosine-5)-methyltransferase 1
MSFNFIDLFCGAGGLSEGLTKAGMNCLVGIDSLKPAIDTFNKNHKGSIGICGDIKEIEIKEIRKLIKRRKVHLICGGPPCQGFSTIGTNNAEDSRNHLFMQYVKFVEGFKPNYILIENVTGLLSKNNINTLTSIFNIFEELGYYLDLRVLSAHHYGAPQARRRVIIIGNNQEIKNLYPEKEFNNPGEKKKTYKKARTVDWAFNNLISYRKKAHNHDVKKASIKKSIEKKRIKHIPQGRSIRYERDEKELLPKKLWFDHDWETMSEKRFREAKLVRLSNGMPSPTIVTDGRRYYHPTEDRYLTVREAAALQSFPPSFIFSGALTNMWTQIGNAVPPLMAESIGKSILRMHKSRKKKVELEKIRDIELMRTIAFKYSEDTSYDNPKLSQKSFDFSQN